MTKRFEFAATYVAGVAHHNFKDRRALETLRLGEPLVLCREHENEHDPNAIEVLTSEDMKLGYIPRVEAQKYALMMDHGYALDAVVDHVDTASLEVQISLRLPSLRGRE